MASEVYGTSSKLCFVSYISRKHWKTKTLSPTKQTKPITDNWLFVFFSWKKKTNLWMKPDPFFFICYLINSMTLVSSTPFQKDHVYTSEVPLLTHINMYTCHTFPAITRTLYFMSPGKYSYNFLPLRAARSYEHYEKHEIKSTYLLLFRD